jgi:type IV secretion system protein VirB5
MKFRLLAFALFSITTATYADIFSDIFSILDRIENINHEIGGNTNNISQNTLDQLNELKSEWRKLSKAYGMSDNKVDQQARLWSANDWNDVLKQASGGNAQRFQELMHSYQSLYPTLEKGNTKVIDMTTLNANSYKQSASTYQAALGASAYTYNDINIRISKLETLLSQVDNESKNQNEKAAIDLNSRLIAELGFIQLELLKLQSIKLQMDATKNQSEFNNTTIDRQFTHYQLP